jgi:hypothetical protein
MRAARIIAAALAVAGWAVPVARAEAPVAVATLETFESGLAAHGEWVVVPAHGRAWRPLGVPASWRPYLHGAWVWTAEGWLWTTDEPWGWATYHYGRWAWDPALGWIWVPGYTWAPAWVAWRYGEGFVGWAPLFPGIDVWWVEPYPIEAGYWIFVPTVRFVGHRIERVVVEPARVPALVRRTRPAPPPRHVPPAPAPGLAPAPAGGGPPPSVVERAVGRPIRAARIVSVRTPAEARAPREAGAVPAFRPPAARPSGTPDRATAQPPPPRAPPAAPAPKPPDGSRPSTAAPAPRGETRGAAPPARGEPREEHERQTVPRR